MKVQLVIDIDVHDEARLRRLAADRMSTSGFEDDPALHINEPIGKLLFEALIGSNPDPMSPDDMGIELISWHGQQAGAQPLGQSLLPIIAYAEQAPASDPGESYWRDLDYAYAGGQKNERFTAAQAIRKALANLGLDVPAGIPLCTGCSADEGEDHEPDCTLPPETDDEDEGDGEI